MIKGTFHKSCGCYMCRLGRGSAHGQFIRNHNERKLRRLSNVACARVVNQQDDDVDIFPISSPYTD